MKKFLKTVWGKLCIGAAALLLLAAILLCGYTLWHYNLPKFKDASAELGEGLPPIESFLTEHAKKENARFVNESQLTLTSVGDYSVTLSHNGKVETVTLTVKDTAAPKVKFKDVTADIDETLRAEDFIEEASDFSEVTVSFVTEPKKGDTSVTVRVTDASNNAVEQVCTVNYYLMPHSFELELGDNVTKEDLLYDPEKYGELIDAAVLDMINTSPVGTYTVTAGDSTCTVTVKDTTAPTLEVKGLRVEVGAAVKLGDFIVKAEDVSGEVTTASVSEISTDKVGTYTLKIEATDVNGNKSSAEAKLEVLFDITAPVISGLTDITVPRGTEPDYKKGVTVKDAKDTAATFSYDASKVDISKPGIYYVTYTAKDSSGNAVTKRRKITVNHTAEDTAALVAEVASSLPSDVLALRDYVRSSIRYTSNWGGEDPVWYGFKNRSGNCYVHATCLEALLKNKGYETMLIWVTDKSHYWNLVKIDGKWRHVDSTPGSKHSKYSEPMTDEMRYSCLQGRDWDRTKWPECN